MKFLPLWQQDDKLLIKDYIWYIANLDTVEDWCQETFGYCKRDGMVLTFNQPEHTMLFMLMWG